MEAKTLVLGAGIAGLAYANEFEKEEAIIFEKSDELGGLCHSFQIEGFTFDSAVHLSFTNNENVRAQFDKSPYITHLPLAVNYYNGYWLKHPVVNNLYQLPPEEKVRLLKSFINREANIKIKNYKDWLIASYGEEISKTFYEVYTQKYWTTDAEILSTTWIGNRLGTPDLEKMLWGAFSMETGIDYYAKEMRYPEKGGYQSFINQLANNVHIVYNKKASKIVLEEKKVIFQDGTCCYFDKLASSIPLPELVNLTVGIPEDIKEAASTLQASKISLVSIGFNRNDIPKNIWFYIYDQDILAARVNSPSMKSVNNAPANCSSLQFEIYHAPGSKINKEEVIDNTRYALKRMGICDDNDILFMDYRLLDYGNVIFKRGMETERNKVRDYFEQKGIDLIGRFGEWEYYWSDQSYMSGKNKGRKRKGECK